MSSKAVILGLLALALQACVAVEPGQSRNEAASETNAELGIGYLRQNQIELASEKLEKALRFNPDSTKANLYYALLQDYLKQDDLAEKHYRLAVKLDPLNSDAANNLGAFLCKHGRERESEKYFLQALENPLYRTPEYAYTNAAVCLLKVDERERAEDYLDKALAAKIDFGPALLVRAELLFDDRNHTDAKFYLDRYHLSGRASPKSLWLAIRNTLELDADGDVTEYGERLEKDFPKSEEYQSWLKIQ